MSKNFTSHFLTDMTWWRNLFLCFLDSAWTLASWWTDWLTDWHVHFLDSVTQPKTSSVRGVLATDWHHVSPSCTETYPNPRFNGINREWLVELIVFYILTFSIFWYLVEDEDVDNVMVRFKLTTHLIQRLKHFGWLDDFIFSLVDRLNVSCEWWLVVK